MSMFLCFLLFQRHADTHFRSWPTAAAIAALKIARAKLYTLLHHVNVPVFLLLKRHNDTHIRSWPTAAAIAARNAFEPLYRIMRDLHLDPITKDDMQMMGVLTSLSLRQNRAK